MYGFQGSVMHELRLGEIDVVSMFRPDTIEGAALYLVLFGAAGLLFSRLLHLAARAALQRQGHPDHRAASFPLQLGTAGVWVIMLILYAHLIPALRAMGTALLTGASVASVVIGLAAQSTLGNLIAGIAITIYRPFSVGDTLVVAAPTGTETGTVSIISLGYTTLRTADNREVVLPNSLVASQATIRVGSAPR
jgi:small conductance mechanosensitive channel